MNELIHGKPSTYTNQKCRCDLCKEAIREYHKSRRVGLGPGDSRHGTASGYSNHGCRCDLCRTAIVKSNAPGQRKRTLKHSYGLTPEQWDDLFQSQEGKCASCGDVPPEDAKRRFHVDHDHSTGAVRGILCHSCNVALGHLKEDQERIAKLGVYLSQWKPF